jgi:hypothetical protein
LNMAGEACPGRTAHIGTQKGADQGFNHQIGPWRIQPT